MIAGICRTLRVLCLGSAVLGLLAACGGGGSSSDTSSSAASSAGSDSSAQSSTAGTLSVPIGVTGFASQGTGTTGGAGAPDTNIYVVHNRAELKAALANQNSPSWSATDTTAQTTAKNEKKIIYIVGSIYGTDLGNGQFANEAYYKSLNTTAAKWDWNLYIQSLDTAYMTDLNAKVAAADADAIAQKAKINALSSARTTFMNIQKAQIELIIPSNTTILGVGTDAKLIDGYFSINATSNIILRNLELQAPLDLAPAYDTTKKEWNARYKALSVVTGKQVWVDHCTFTDGANQDIEKLTINGTTLPVMRHDGLLDIEDSSDYFTISYTVFKSHDKTNMVGGSGDGNGGKERAYNHLTFSNNIWQDSVQRAPRARFGQIHLYNNSYGGDTDHAIYPVSYYIGMGAESKILSEANVFDMTGSKATVSRVMSNLNGYQFKDVGSWFNGVPASAELEAAAKAALDARYSSAASAGSSSGFTVAAYTNVLGWTPSYAYTLGSSAATVREHNLANAGAGKLPVTAASATRPMLDDTAAANATIAKALAGSDAWAPQSVNAGQPNAGRLYPAGFAADYVVAKDGSGSHTTIQAALNAASTSTAARVYIQVKAGDYNEQLIVGNTTTTITLYSTESDAKKVRIYSALAKGSAQSSYTALVGTPYDSSVYAGNADAKTVYNLCMAAGKLNTIGTECSATLRVRNNGFQLVNITVENAFDESTLASNQQANAVMIDKADKVVLDGVRLLGNQDTLYLANSGKRVFVTASEIVGDVDFIYGAGVGVFEGCTIRTLGARKPSGTSIASPSTTLAAQTIGLLFNNSVFLADSATTADSIYLARQWNDAGSSTDIPGRMLVRNSVLGKHVALTSGPWSPTTTGTVGATVLSSGGLQYLGEYRNGDDAQPASSGGSTSSAASSSAASSSAGASSSTASSSSAASSSVASSASSAASSSGTSASSSASVVTGTSSAIAGSTTLTNYFVEAGLPATGVTTSYDSVNGTYTLVSAGKYSSPPVNDSVQYAYTQVTGDFTFTADLTSMSLPTGYNAADVTAGLMIRNTLSATSQYYYIVLRGSKQVRAGWRKLAGGNQDSQAFGTVAALPTAAAPLKLKLQRIGQTITVSYSTDAGVSWTSGSAYAQNFGTDATFTPFDSTVYIGLAGGSGNNTTSSLLSTSTFKSLSLTTP